MAIQLIEWPMFDKVILLAITLNCILLMLEDPICRCTTSVCKPWDNFQQSFFSWDCSWWPARQALLDGSEIAFAAFFAFEMAVKIVARGFVLHKHAYLREPLNWIDFVVVVASLVSLLPTVNISILRTFRVLRPLRTLSRIKSMKPILATFARSLTAVANVWAVLALFLCMFGILSIELMAGTLRGYCYFDPRPGRNNFTDAAYSRLISQQTPFLAEQDNNLGGWNVYVQTCRPDDEQAYGPSSGYICPPQPIDGVNYATTCSTKKWCGTDWCINDWNGSPLDIGAGYINYDNIASAIMTNFQTMTFAGWNDVQYRMASGGNIWLSRMYHTSWIFVGNFVVMQLVLAVLNESFDQAQDEQRTEREREALYEEAILIPPGVDYEIKKQEAAAASGKASPRQPRRCFTRAFERDGWVANRWAAARGHARSIAFSPWFQRTMNLVIVANFICLALEYHDQDTFEDSICKQRCGGDPRLPPSAQARCQGPLFNRSWTFDGNGGGTRPNQGVFCFIDRDVEIADTDWLAAGGDLRHSNCSLARDVDSCTDAGASCGWVRGRCMLGLYSATSFAVNVSGSWTLQLNQSSTLTLRDLCGSVSEFGARCPNYPVTLKERLEWANYAFTLLFVIELVIKLLAMGFIRSLPEPGSDIGASDSPPGYFSDAFNWLDFAIVITSAVESMITLSSGSKGTAGNTLTSLRALRILRLFRLVRSWKGMQDLLVTLRLSFTSIWPLFILILLFMYVFALLGIQLFGGKFRFFKTDAPRSNFDSFLPGPLGHGALMAIFQIISLENWDNILACGMLGFQMTQANCLFFMVTVLLGNFVFINLFTSILLSSIGEAAVGDDPDEQEELAAASKAGPVARAFAVSRAAFRFIQGKPLSQLRGRGRVAPNEQEPPAEGGQGASVTETGAGAVEEGVNKNKAGNGTKPVQAENSAGSQSVRREPEGGLESNHSESPLEVEARPEILSQRRARAAAPTLDGVSIDPSCGSCDGTSVEGSPSGGAAAAGPPSSCFQESSVMPGDDKASRKPSVTVTDPVPLDVSTISTLKACSEEYNIKLSNLRHLQRSSWAYMGMTQESCPVADHNAFFVLPPSNPLRRWAAVASRHPVVDGLMLAVILVSSITLLLEAPDDVVVSSDNNCPPAPGFLDCTGAATLGQAEMINCPREDGPFFGKAFPPCGSAGAPGCCSTKSKMAVLKVLELVFTIVFLVEMVLKIVADGLILHPNAYLRDGWNMLDCLVVVSSMASVFGSGTTKDLKAFRTLRALRPLRVVKSNPGLRVAVDSLLKSLPAMANVSLVVLFWLVVYSLLGVQLFKGCFSRCYDYSSQYVYGSSIFPLSNNIFAPTPLFSGPQAVPSIVECVAVNGGGTTSWSNRPFGFDNIFRALLTLFEMLTTTGWLEMLQSMVDTTYPGLSPFVNRAPALALYAVVQIIVGNWVLVNLVQGAVLSTYVVQKRLSSGIVPRMSEEAKEWQELVALMSRLRPAPQPAEASTSLQRSVRRVADSFLFDVVVRAAIVCSVVIQMTRTHDQSGYMSVVIFWTNTAITTLFTAEIGVKMLAYGPRHYLSSGLNRFDVLVTVLSIVRVALDAAAGEYDPVLAVARDSLALRLIRALCVLRAFRLLRLSEGVQRMVRTIWASMGAVSNLGALVLLIALIVALLGWNLFFNVNLAQDAYQRMGGYNVPYASYTTFDTSLWLIFRLSTGDFWNGLMYYPAGMLEVDDTYQRCAFTHPDYLGNGCGGPAASITFHVMWIVFGQFTLMQLFSAVIVETFAELSRGDRSNVPHWLMKEFVSVWERLDPQAKGKIHVGDLPLLLVNVSAPLGVKTRVEPLVKIASTGGLERIQGQHKAASLTSVIEVIKQLKIPLRRSQMIAYGDTFIACARRVTAVTEDTVSEDLGLSQADDEKDAGPTSVFSWTRSSGGTASTDKDRSKAYILDIRGQPYTVAGEYAARRVQMAFRQYRASRPQNVASLTASRRPWVRAQAQMRDNAGI